MITEGEYFKTSAALRGDRSFWESRGAAGVQFSQWMPRRTAFGPLFVWRDSCCHGGVIGDHAELSRQVIGAAIEVHRVLGPGLLESAYSKCLALELADRGIPFDREVAVPVFYKDRRVDHGFRADFVIDSRLLVEIKCVATMPPVYRAQVITYLKLLRLSRGLLINFHARRLTDGVSSVVG